MMVDNRKGRGNGYISLSNLGEIGKIGKEIRWKGGKCKEGLEGWRRR